MKWLLFIFIFKISTLFAITDTLYINKGSLATSSGTTAFCSFNSTDSLTPQNKIFQVLLSDTLHLTIINNDTLDHTFTIDGFIDNPIGASSTIDIEVKFITTGTYSYFSDKSYGKLIGATGIISVVEQQDIHYYWNLFETDSDLSFDLANTTVSTINSNSYTPDLFSINGFTYPNTNTDSLGHIVQNVGDTIYISIINSGNMEHTLHFHGYHVELLDIKINKKQQGWFKDTFPIKLGEAMTVKLIPHQPGMFPVHDHNLINVTNAGSYPGGMITVLNIQ